MGHFLCDLRTTRPTLCACLVSDPLMRTGDLALDIPINVRWNETPDAFEEEILLTQTTRTYSLKLPQDPQLRIPIDHLHEVATQVNRNTGHFQNFQGFSCRQLPRAKASGLGS